MECWAVLPNIFLIIALWLGLAFAFYRILVIPRGTRFDFYAPWAGVQAVAQGLDPYSEQVSRSIQRKQEIFFPHPYGGGFVYPPHLLILFFPIALLPFPIFISLWIAALFLLCQFSIIMGLQLLGISPRVAMVGILCITALFYRYTMIGITFGQPACFALAMLVLAAWLIHKDKDYLSSMALVAAAIKPDLTFGPIFLFLGISIYHRRFKVLWGMLGTTIVLCLAITFLLGLHWPSSYFGAVKAYTEYHLSTWGLTGPPIWMWPLAWAVLLFTFWVLWDNLKKARWSWLAALSVNSSLILIPQSGTYNLTFLLAPIFVGWAWLRGAWRWLWLAIWWLLPWLIWALSDDPNTDLRIVPWLLAIGLLVLTFFCERGAKREALLS